MTNMDSLASHLPKVDNKALEFDVDIRDGQFNLEGRYFLKLSVQNLEVTDYSMVMLRKGNEPMFTAAFAAETDTVSQVEASKVSRFQEKKFQFRLPQGFCKNDKMHDVHLLVEAFVQPKNGGKSRKVGEGKFAIYPRPNAPRIKANVDPGDDFYHFTDVLSLLRTVSTDSVQMHCGRIRCTFALRELLPPRPKTPIVTPPPPRKKVTPRRDPPEPTPEPTPREPPQSTSPWGDNISLHLPSSPTLPPANEGKKLPEGHLLDSDRKTFFIGQTYRHVAKKGKEQVDVIVHGSISLPSTPNGNPPLPYPIIKNLAADKKKMAIGSPGHTTLRPTHAPSWEEMLTISMTDAESGEDVLVIAVADGPTKERLVSYEIPMAYLEPFHQYHLELVKPVQGIKSGVRTFITITRKLDHLIKDPASPQYLGLEWDLKIEEPVYLQVMLRSVQKPFKHPLGPLIAVARMVPDYYNYKSDNLLSHPRTAAVSMTSVTFPSPHPSSFKVPPRTKHGYPQISLPGRPDTQPLWNHPYLFSDERDKATLFTPGAALVLEYYIATAAMSDQFWKIRSPIGYSSILMDKDIYSELTSPRAKHGLRLEGVPIQGEEVEDINGDVPKVGMVLRLITTTDPDTMVSTSDIDALPSLDMFPDQSTYFRTTPDILKVEGEEGSVHTEGTALTKEQEGVGEDTDEEDNDTVTGRLIPTPPGGGYYMRKQKKRPLSPTVFFQVHTDGAGEPIKDGEMPPHGAVDSVLPDYQYVFVDPQGKQHAPRGRQPSPTGRIQRQPPKAAPQQPNVPAAYAKYAAPAVSLGPHYRDRLRILPEDSRQPDLDNASMNVLDHQSKELENYRLAVQKMGQDMVALQERIRELENNNSQLRRDLANYNDASKLMIESAELDGLSKPEIMSRYAALKQTLQSQTSDLNTYKDKVQKIQNELISKNDEEKKLLKQSQSQSGQSVIIQRLQERITKYKKMEEACKKQEVVIEKMERLLEKQNKDKSKKGDRSSEANEALLEENKRLRSQTEELREQLRTAGRGGDEKEKFAMYQALERADARVLALEKQLAENSRQWGKERADMQLRLNEAEHGFGRSQGMVLHDYPTSNSYERTGRSYPTRYTPKQRLSPIPLFR
ncbi:Coiled-coil domain-containing protein 33 [Mizuhopecten yessoensis]|uniref:Coiled-coil domain-containing protein 33 n=1 Tax=Mizuhopecten yessoensis TaxID=6573 RepID=A0A210R653_MIZYE|nr:Coiled-coil domain-containing protein 33 [Mizuhopecten yessoensis]